MITRRILLGFAIAVIGVGGLAGCGVVRHWRMHATLEKHRHLPPEQAKLCVAGGGFVANRGMFGSAVCAHQFADAGKVCSGKSDCFGRCIIREGVWGKADPKAGALMSGMCEADNATDGCYAVIEGGMVTGSECDD